MNNYRLQTGQLVVNALSRSARYRISNVEQEENQEGSYILNSSKIGEWIGLPWAQGTIYAGEFQRLPNTEVVNFPIRIEAPHETIGGFLQRTFTLTIQHSRLIKSAWDKTFQSNNEMVATQARQLLSIIQDSIEALKDKGVELDHLPPVQATNLDDGSILIEWAFKDLRIGFNIETEKNDSGWYLVSNEKLGEINAGGLLAKLNLRDLVNCLSNFLILIPEPHISQPLAGVITWHSNY